MAERDDNEYSPKPIQLSFYLKYLASISNSFLNNKFYFGERIIFVAMN